MHHMGTFLGGVAVGLLVVAAFTRLNVPVATTVANTVANRQPGVAPSF